MDKNLQTRSVLDSFPNSTFVGIKREYHTGQSGSPVFAVQYKRKNDYGLQGTFIVKIGSVEWARAEEDLYQSLAASAFAPLLARCHMPSLPTHDLAAVAYDVAFDSLLEPQPLMSILEKEAQSEAEVQKQIAGLAMALVHGYTEQVHRQKSVVEDQHTLLLRMLTKARTGDLLRRVGEALPFWNSQTRQIAVDGLKQRLPNPLIYMQKETWQSIGHNPNCPIGRIHGDLHTGNVICSLTSQSIPHIIDFDQSLADGVPFFDLAYLEFDIMRRLLSVEQAENRRHWLALLDMSMAKITGGPHNSIPWNAARAWRLIQPIRQSVQQLQASGGEDYEIVWWLSTVAVGLNFARKGDLERSHFERMAGLLYAAYGLARIRDIFAVEEETIREPIPFVPWLRDERSDPHLIDPLPLSDTESLPEALATEVNPPVPIDLSLESDSSAPPPASFALFLPQDPPSVPAPATRPDDPFPNFSQPEPSRTVSTESRTTQAAAEASTRAAEMHVQKLLQNVLAHFHIGGYIYRDTCDTFDEGLQQLESLLQIFMQNILQNQYQIKFLLENVSDLQKTMRSALLKFREVCPPLNTKQLSLSRYNEERVAISKQLEELLQSFLELLKHMP